MPRQEVSHSHAGPTPMSGLPEGFVDFLDLEGLLSSPVTRIALEEASSVLDFHPSLVIDLGSGTGVGTVALARKFPNAQIRGIDISSELLERLTAASSAAGISDRVQGHLGNFEDNWHELVPAKASVIWAALSLHHASDPAKVLRHAFEALQPGGILVVTEMTGPPVVETVAFDGLYRPSQRLSEALAHLQYRGAGDWVALIEAAGFTVMRQRDAVFVAATDSDEGARYVSAQLSFHRGRHANTLSSKNGEDCADAVKAVAEIDAAMKEMEAGTSSTRFTSGRSICVAIRPHDAVHDEDGRAPAFVGSGS
ncbi:class I SAM-dependent methyltransferase [Arthrobacter frigidicola]|nr:class I SAM-dependent methyltransferase [Arthrobacter frigidicola]